MQYRPYQAAAIDSIFTYFQHNTGNPVVALPTGTGKSVVIGGFLKAAYHWFPRTRSMMLTHVKELIEQNAGKLQRIWPQAPLGIYSAGLGIKQHFMPITFGGVASVVKCVPLFGWIDFVIIDEAHLVSPEAATMYQQIIRELKAVNSRLKVIGLTATPYRLGQGMITDSGIFTDICFDLTSYREFNQLVADGYLANLVPRPTRTEIDISGVGTTAGDFNQAQLEKAVDKEEITHRAVKEIVEAGYDRHSWMIFGDSIKHVEHIHEELQTYGLLGETMHSKKSDNENAEIMRAFKCGQLRYVVNKDMLTTGVDHPPLDLIGMIRHTKSPGLWVQMLGRGTRPYDWTNPEQRLPGFDFTKRNCLVLDFAKNSERLGPINDPQIPKKKGEGGGDPPIKICEKVRLVSDNPGCGSYNHPSARYCILCAEEFSFVPKIEAVAGNARLIKTDEDEAPVDKIEWFDVMRVHYMKHIKRGAPDSKPLLKTQYYCGNRVFTQYTGFESDRAIVRHMAHEWWRQRHAGPAPETVDDVLKYEVDLKIPKRIRVNTGLKYPEILAVEF